MGNVGFRSDEFAIELPIWRLVGELRVSLADIEAYWTFDRIMKANAYLDMKADYRIAWEEFYKNKPGDNDG